MPCRVFGTDERRPSTGRPTSCTTASAAAGHSCHGNACGDRADFANRVVVRVDRRLDGVLVQRAGCTVGVAVGVAEPRVHMPHVALRCDVDAAVPAQAGDGDLRSGPPRRPLRSRVDRGHREELHRLAGADRDHHRAVGSPSGAEVGLPRAAAPVLRHRFAAGGARAGSVRPCITCASPAAIIAPDTSSSSKPRVPPPVVHLRTFRPEPVLSGGRRAWSRRAPGARPATTVRSPRSVSNFAPTTRRRPRWRPVVGDLVARLAGDSHVDEVDPVVVEYITRRTNRCRAGRRSTVSSVASVSPYASPGEVPP